jgi:hypothetical protein
LTIYNTGVELNRQIASKIRQLFTKTVIFTLGLLTEIKLNLVYLRSSENN